MIRLANIKIRINKAADHNMEMNAIKKAVIARLKIKESELTGFNIFKKSIDARKKEEIYYVYTIDAEVIDHERILTKSSSKATTITPDPACHFVTHGNENLIERPVIIGMGPAGLFAGLLLAKNGYKPIILERGEDVDARTVKVKHFWQNSILDTESNVQFGEGGAGTFSDGKLTTLINDKRCRMILEEFIKAGAPAEIIYLNKPHIGTDLLKSTVKNIRQEIINHGGEVRFQSKATDFIIKNDKIEAVVINEEEKLKCNVILLAIGHSARDTFQVLHRRGINMKQKPFSIGVRIEHPQPIINKAQYGEAAEFTGLGAADYKLVYHANNGRSAYTFCMCPGGFVVAAASEANTVVTNGMSYYKRDGENANAAVLVGINPADFNDPHPLAGIDFQRKWERMAFQLGGDNYLAPAQLTGDFLSDKPSTGWGSVKPTYQPGVTFAPLKECLPGYAVETLKEAIVYFNTKIKGFSMPDSILTGVETRSSSPVRISRDESLSSNIKGLYPMGEGAGYAGGIMSSAVDGVKTAEVIMAKYAPINKMKP